MARSRRIFVREIASQSYELDDYRHAQLEAQRVFAPGREAGSGGSPAVEDAASHGRNNWRIGPGDDPFLTQTLQIHFVHIPAGASKKTHAHQNEAAFFILRGSGFDTHDGLDYSWEAGDLVIVHSDSVHQHSNTGTEEAVALVVKAKSAWLFMGLMYQGYPDEFHEDGYGPRESWSSLWTHGVEERQKILRPSQVAWEETADGSVKVLASPERDDVRLHSLDLNLQRVAPGSWSAKHWHMADEAVYILSGSGYALHWDVRAEYADRYYAHIATEPTTHPVRAGDTMYIPQNTVHQFFSDEGTEPLVFLSARNRLFRYMGYDSVVQLEEAPRYRL